MNANEELPAFRIRKYFRAIQSCHFFCNNQKIIPIILIISLGREELFSLFLSPSPMSFFGARKKIEMVGKPGLYANGRSLWKTVAMLLEKMDRVIKMD